MTSEAQAGEMLRAGLPPAQDRMLTTCFVAVLLHGIVILGVTFSEQIPDADRFGAPALEVLLVNGQAPSALTNPNARYLAQHTQSGSGNTLKNERTAIPRSSMAPMDQEGSTRGEGAAGREGASESGDDQLLATRAPAVKVLYFAAATTVADPSPAAQLLENRPDFGMAANDEGIELRLRGDLKRQLWVAADTRESDVALYLDGWRRKVERMGTLHFPDVARRKNLSGTPVIEVTIGADGTLLKAQVQRSSGHAEIDEAAVRILKLAAPYDPFPGELNAKHDEIRIAYEWQFLGGAPSASGVHYGEPKDPYAAP